MNTTNCKNKSMSIKEILLNSNNSFNVSTEKIAINYDIIKANKLTYVNQLKHPNWQRKRLEIFQRDNFACVICDNKEHQLSVHHLCYFPNIHIWDYDNELMITVCPTCHEICQFEMAKLAGLLASKIIQSKFDVTNIDWLIDILKEHK